MKRILLTLALLLTPSVAWAQCTGLFPSNYVCGNNTASPAPPKPIPQSGGGGAITSVGLTMPSVFSVAGSPIVSGAGTLAVTANGTSGGIPYFSAATTMASSGALTANAPVLGGGAGASPTVGTRTGNTTAFATFSGATTSGRCVQLDASGNLAATAGACSSATPGGSTTQVQFNNAGVFDGSANLTWVSPTLTIGVAGATTGQLVLTGGTSGSITLKGQAVAGTYNFNLPTSAGTAGTPLLSGGGSGSPMTYGTLSGNTSVFATQSGSVTVGNCYQADASGNLSDSGSVCGGGGTPGPPTGVVQDFVAPGDFTPGTTTTLTLSSAPVDENILTIMFDGVAQAHNTYSLAGSVVTFSAAIPSNIVLVEAQWYTGGGGGSGSVGSSTANNLAYYAVAGTSVTGLATANNGTLVTSGAGVPSISSTLPTAVQNNITRTGTLVAGATGTGFTLAFGSSTMTGTVPAANLPTGSSAALGVLRGDGSTTTITAGIIACTTATSSQIGCSKPDATTISIAAGVISANASTDYINVKNPPYNAVGNGSTDDTTAINAAIAAMVATAGKCVYFPVGTYKITSALTSITTTTSMTPCFTGDTPNASLITTPTTGTILTITGSTGTTFYISNIGFTAASNRTANSFLDLGNSGSGHLYNVRFNNCFICVDSHIPALFASYVFLNEGQTTANTSAVLFKLGVCTATCFLDHFFTGYESTQPAKGLELNVTHGNIGNVVLTDSAFQEAGNCIDITPASGVIATIFVANVIIDTCSGTNFLVKPTGTGIVELINISNSWSGSSGNNGWHFENTGSGVFDVRITTTSAISSGNVGFFASGVTGFSLTNSISASNGLHGIAVADGGTIQITNNVSGTSGTYGANGGRGIFIDGTTDHYIVSGNIVRNNTTAQITDTASGTDKLITGLNICGAGACP